MKTNYILLALVLLTIGLTTNAQTFTPYAAGTADIYASAKANYPNGLYNSGSTVLLNDLEDHNWTLYSDPESPITSLYPRNVQIIYNGYGKIFNGNGTVGDMSVEQPAALTDKFVDMTPGQNGQTVAVGAATDAERAANRFVYLKTLERSWPFPSETRFADRAIANPFYVRPVYSPIGSAITPQAEPRNAVWRGFYRWRLKSVAGGSIYTEESGGTPLAVGDLVKADQLLWYQPTNNGYSNAVNELSMAVEFEAVWTRAYVLYTGQAALSTTSSLKGGSTELNFVVYRHESTGNTTMSVNGVPATYTAVFPNGTTDGIAAFNGTLPAALATVQINNGAVLSQPLKLEYLKMYGNSSKLYACGNSVTYGRGLQFATSDNGIWFIGLRIMAINGNFTGDKAPVIRFESGRHSSIELVGTRTLCETEIESTCIFGNDYDRALGDNNKLSLNYAIQGGGYNLPNYPNTVANRNRKVINFIFKSGIHNVKRPLPPSSAYFSTGHSIFMGSQSSRSLNEQYLGHRTLIVEGGELADILGARTGYDAEHRPNDGYPDIYIRFKGGVSDGFIGGAAQHIRGGGDPLIICTGGTLKGYIAAGANATWIGNDYAYSMVDPASICTGDLLGNTNVYVGGYFHVSMEGDTILGAQRGCIFASGCGFDYGNYRSNIMRSRGEVNNSTVVVADHAVVDRNVFGGGNMGNVKEGGTATIYIAGGLVKGKVFGGGNKNKLPHGHVDITMKDGTVLGGIHGGSNIKGLVTGDISVKVLGGIVGYIACHDSLGNVFGCGYGENTEVTSGVEVIIGKEAGRLSHVDNPLVHSNVYVGGDHGPYNSTGNTLCRVKTYNGRIKRNVFGGGHGRTAVFTGNTIVNILGTTHIEGSVYGGGNMAKLSGNSRVVIGEDTSSFTLTVASSNDAMGTVSGGGVYMDNTDVRLRATPSAGHRFKQWNDGSTQNPRTVTVHADASYTAEFEVRPIYTITVAVADGQAAMGTVEGGGDYPADRVVRINATHTLGYLFKQWNDGNTDNPRYITVAGDATYSAEFELLPAGWVDMGLPSGLLWAECNLGANSPEGYGDYFAWGETTPKESYTWNNYIYGAHNQFTKYCNNSANGYSGYVDTLITLEPMDDAATAILGGGARMPIAAEWQELIDNTTQSNETRNGVAGRKLTSKINGNSIFIPFAGHMSGTELTDAGTKSPIWTSSYGTYATSTAMITTVTDSSCHVNNGSRLFGFPIRAVRK